MHIAPDFLTKARNKLAGQSKPSKFLMNKDHKYHYTKPKESNCEYSHVHNGRHTEIKKPNDNDK